MTVVCWVESETPVGGDRAARAAAIVQRLQRRGVQVRLVVSGGVIEPRWARGLGTPEVRWVAASEDALCVVRACARAAEAIVIDVPQALSRGEVDVLRRRWPVLLIDNPGGGAEVADLVLSTRTVAGDRRWLSGPAFVPLLRPSAPRGQRQVGPGGLPLVLVHVGQPGAADVTGAAVEALGRLEHPRVTAHVIVEATAPVWPALPRLLGRLGFPPAHPHTPESVATHLALADFAILRHGHAVYEALASGVPALVVSTDARECAAVEALAASGALVSLGVAPSLEQIAGAAAALAGDRRLRNEMVRAGRALVDGRGAERVVDRLLAVVDGDEVRHVAD